MTKREKYLARLNKVGSLILISIAFMWLTPQGSFNPKEWGFYLSILQAFVMVLLFTWLMKPAPKGQHDDSHDTSRK